MLHAFMTTGGRMMPSTVVCDNCLRSAYVRLNNWGVAKEDEVDGQRYDGQGRMDVERDRGFVCVYCGDES